MTGRTVVVGTAGHIDHGKTTLLRALTGIETDRLPEERRRGMTIDIGYAHLVFPDATSLDFVDVPGHDRLVGNMLVGAGEIDAALLVVAADDGPRAQTFEHLQLLDALAIRHGIAVVTKVDAVPRERVQAVRDAVHALLARTGLAGAPVLAVSAAAGTGLEVLRAQLRTLRDRVVPEPSIQDVDLAIDRAFSIKGRGTVVTGTLRGGPLAAGTELELVPARTTVRVREVQVHGQAVERAPGGRTAVLLGGADGVDVRRGDVLARPGTLDVSSRLLVTLRPASDLARARRIDPAANGTRLRLHLRTEGVGALVVRSPREQVAAADRAAIAILRLERAVAVRPGDRFALRDPSGSGTAHGGQVLDTMPPRGMSRRRVTPERLVALRDAVHRGVGVAAARLDLHGLQRSAGQPVVAGDVEEAMRHAALATVRAHHESTPGSPGVPAVAVRTSARLALRRVVTVAAPDADTAAAAMIRRLVDEGLLVRDGDRLRDAGRPAGLAPDIRAAMDRLEAALSTPSPPPLAVAARAAGCPADGIRALEAERRIVRLEDDLAWSAATYRELARRAVTMAAGGPLTPAAFRDATGSSRRYALAILEDLDRRELLRRTEAGHVLGRRSLARVRPAEPSAP